MNNVSRELSFFLDLIKYVFFSQDLNSYVVTINLGG